MITLAIWLTVALSLPAGAIAAAHLVVWLTSGGG